MKTVPFYGSIIKARANPIKPFWIEWVDSSKLDHFIIINTFLSQSKTVYIGKRVDKFNPFDLYMYSFSNKYVGVSLFLLFL